MTEDFGSYLKSERELRGVPLEEISSVTKIPTRYLQALENNQFDDLPGEVFIKGYIRSIAKVIGSDPNSMLSTYDEISKQLSSNIKTETVPVVEDKIPIDMDFILKLGLIILFLAGLGWGISIAIEASTRGEKPSNSLMIKPDHNKVNKLSKRNLSELDKEIKNELTPPSKNLTPSSALKETADFKNQTEKPLSKR